ncbi:MAG: phenylacetate--CoA ligase family protein [Clostridia bacterium]|nr:phenylacetate--CoA ligase family protein [Clostridia bacterium]
MNPYEMLMGAAVEAKRLLKGHAGKAGFTRYLESIQYKSRDEIMAIQAWEMSALLKHTVENIPYYSYMKGGLRLEPDTVNEDIKEFPVMTKAIIKENFDRLHDETAKNARRFKTGGTSGTSAIILRDKNEEVHSADEYFNRMAGVIPGRSRLMIRRPESVYFADNPSDVEYSSNMLSRTHGVSPAYMDKERLALLYSLYIKKHPRFIIGITDPVYRFAQYILDDNLKTYEAEAVLLGGQTMLPKYKKTIARAFRTDRIYDRYGATEFGILGHQCGHSDGLHYIPAIHYVEVVDNDYKDVETGVTGQFLVTNLHKRTMPLIRYRIDDLATMTNESCGCGRGFPLIRQFEGRRIEAVVSPKHTYMTPLSFYDAMENFENVADFVAVQTGESTVTMKLLMKHGAFTDLQRLALRKDVNRYLDYPMKLEFEYIDSIDPLPNGKVMNVIGYENYKSGMKHEAPSHGA